MKRKKLDKKLRLNKETISNIDAVQLSGIKSGVSMGSICCPDTYTCRPIPGTCHGIADSQQRTCSYDPQSNCQ